MLRNDKEIWIDIELDFDDLDPYLVKQDKDIVKMKRTLLKAELEFYNKVSKCLKII